MAPTVPPALAFADQLGFLFETTGGKRLAGRVMGWLIACDPPHQSAADMATVLGVSRSAISPITQAMVRQGFIEQVRVPGQREVHYRISDDGWVRTHREAVAGLAANRKLAEQALVALEDRGPVVNGRLRTFLEFHRFLEREAPAILDRWEAEFSRSER